MSRTTPCKFFLQGYCKYGEGCKYSHESATRPSVLDVRPGERVMAGAWCTPLPVAFREEAGSERLRFTSDSGDLQVTIEPDDDRQVTLSAAGGDVSVKGKANFEFTRIQWENGAVWHKDESVRERSSVLVQEQTNLLSDRQADLVIDRLNAAIDIPLLSEGMERQIFSRIVGQLNPLMKSALGSCMPSDLLGAFSMLLNDTKPRGDKHEHIRSVLKTRIKEPLINFLHGHVDMAFVPDSLEKQVLRKVVGMMLRQMVEQMVVGLERSGFASHG